MPPTVFISYSHQDENWKDRLVLHLAGLERAGRLSSWNDRRIGVGQEWLREIETAMEKARVAVLLTREIGDLLEEGIACWNLGLALEKLGEIGQAAEMMQICVDYEREIGHQDAEKDAAYVERLRARLGPPSFLRPDPTGSQGSPSG